MKTKNVSILAPSLVEEPWDQEVGPDLSKHSIASAARDVDEPLSDFSRPYLAQAPWRLDVMGGVCDFTGCLCLSTPLDGGCTVVAQRVKESALSIRISRDGVNGRPPTVIRLSQIGEVEDADNSSLLECAGLPESDRLLIRAVYGTLVEILRANSGSPFNGGLSLTINTQDDVRADLGQEASVICATAGAISGAIQQTLEPLSVVRLCRTVRNSWLGQPVGPADGLAVVFGEPQTILEARTDILIAPTTMRLPRGISLIGIDCGRTPSDADAKFVNARTAAYMGRFLINKIMASENFKQPTWEGWLSRLSISDFSNRFRDRLPRAMTGEDFLRRFGETGDELTQVDSGEVYKIRSRTEHQVYEHARARRFCECLARADRTNDPKSLREAGLLLYTSHWSYGQRCGLDSVETDLLVKLLRQFGQTADILGAKITGRGRGGVVAVMFRQNAETEVALAGALEAYKIRTGLTPRRLADSV